MILAAFRTHLAADATVAGLVGTAIYGDDVPQDAAPPFVALQLISAPRQYVLAGSTGHARPRVQVDCWAATKLAAIEIADAVTAALEDVRFSYGGVAVGPSRIVSSRDLESLLQTLPQMRGRSIDILTWTSE